MKVSARIILSLILTTALVTLVFSYLQVQKERASLIEDLNNRAIIFSKGLQNSAIELLETNSPKKLNSLIKRFSSQKKFIDVIVYDSLGRAVTSSPNTITSINDSSSHIKESIRKKLGVSALVTIKGKLTYTYAFPLIISGKSIGALLVLNDASYVDSKLSEIWQANFLLLLVQALLIISITLLIVRWRISSPIEQVVSWMKNVRAGKANNPASIPTGDILKPLTDEIALLAKSLANARLNARDNNSLNTKADTFVTTEKLKQIIHSEIGNKNLIVISNREPYQHTKRDGNIEWSIPPGGLVTALDPVLTASGGVWIAQGSGDADAETSDEKGKLFVPPDKPAYTLRRVFLTPEEEEGYYYGFSNEGIWPLCHITHTRPIFRLEDWIHYQNVNQKFADTVLDEISDVTEPLILIQDYHFALLPFLIKSKRPDARVALFWHIPWPNPEVIGICPWKQELLIGLLGADLVCFHIQFHCNNFLETVDRYLESKINWDEFSVERNGELTFIKPFPISIAFPQTSNEELHLPFSKKKERDAVFKQIGIQAEFIGVGVDRIDYTKGIVERMKGIERFLEKYPEYIGRFTFVELGAPSRTHIKRYKDLMDELDETIDSINNRFMIKNWKPIVFLKANHKHDEINKFYKAANLCLVTSLHDGMNLVAKEFIASRDDEDGVLILSRFTGAAYELHDALIINPYSIEEIADSLHNALSMEIKERNERIRRMRQILRERNVYRWAGNIITTLVRLRISPPVKQPVLHDNDSKESV